MLTIDGIFSFLNELVRRIIELGTDAFSKSPRTFFDYIHQSNRIKLPAQI